MEKTRFVGRIPMIWDNAGNARIGESRYGDFVPKTDITHIHEQMRSYRRGLLVSPHLTNTIFNGVFLLLFTNEEYCELGFMLDQLALND